MAGQLNPYNNVGHVFAAYSYLDTPLHKKTIKGGNVSAAAGHNLTQNQDANFENPGYMDAYVGFRIMRQTTWTETPINFTADPEYVTHDHYQQISCEAQTCTISTGLCNDACETCSGPSVINCLTCRPGMYLTSMNNCFCSGGFTDQFGSCRDSDTACLATQWYTNSTCEDCPGDRECWRHGTESASCNPGSILDTSNNCNCDPSVHSFEIGEWCEPDYPYCPTYTFASNGVCELCHSSCATCSSNSDNRCLSCGSRRTLNGRQCPCDGSNISDDDGQCVCNEGYGWDDNTGACVALTCEIQCETCMEYAGLCTACKAGLTHTVTETLNGLSTGTCTCPTGSTINSAGSCDCDSAALTFDAATGTCACPTGFYAFDGACHDSCTGNCVACTGPTAADCTTCDSGYEWDAASTSCVVAASVCELGYGLEDPANP